MSPERWWHRYLRWAEWFGIGIGFVPRDLWIGIYISEREPREFGWYRTVYVALVPTIVFYFDVRVERCYNGI